MIKSNINIMKMFMCIYENGMFLLLFFCLFLSLFLFYAYEYFISIKYVYRMHTCEVRRIHQIPLNWNYRRLGAVMWTLGTKHGPL